MKQKTEEIGGYLIYHPKREIYNDGGNVVYHGSFQGNQDPYIWNEEFLHTFCHITQMKPEIGHINFWVSGDTFPNFTKLYCDLVFVVAKKEYWSESNQILENDKLIDSSIAYKDHYVWHHEHYFKRRRRFTLKADPFKSFQPQDHKGNLIDIIPVLDKYELNISVLQKGLREGKGSNPLKITKETAKALKEELHKQSQIKLKGLALQKLRKKIKITSNNSDLRNNCR